MPQPSTNQAHVDAVLTNMSVAYVQKQDHFIASKVFPNISVEKKSGIYVVYTKADWFRDEAKRRAGGTESAGSGYGIDNTPTYLAEVHALHKDIDDQFRAAADAPIDPDREAVMFLTQRMLLRQEIQWVTDFFTTGVWATDVVGTTNFVKWSTYATSDPIGDIETGKEAILKSTGQEANTLVLGYEVWRQLKHHPDVVDRYKHVDAGSITTQMVAALLEIDRILVAKAIKNTAVENETAVMAFTHGKDALLCHTAPSPGLLTPSAGYTFSWRGVSDGLGETVGVSSFRMPELKSDRIEVERAWDNKVVASDLGYFFDEAVA